MNTQFDIERAARFLEAEIVVKPCVGQVAALQSDVVASLFETICQREVVRQLVGHVGFRILVADILPVERKGVLPESVVTDRERIPSGEKVVPVERSVEIGKPVGNVRQPHLVVHILLLRRSCPVPFVVAGVDAVPGAAEVKPAGERVAQ